MANEIQNDLIKCMLSSVRDGIKSESCEKFAENLQKSSTYSSKIETPDFRSSLTSKKLGSYAEALNSPDLNTSEHRDFSPSGRVR
jgi:hypothetical protein